MSALRGLLLCLVLLLPSAALPRKQGRDSLVELSLLEEPGLGAEGRKVGNGSSQETPRSRRAAATRLFSKPEPGAKCPQEVAEEGGPSWSRSSPQPWPLGGLEGPVCRVRMEQDGASPRQLEVVGVLSHYESSFIKLLRRRRSWDGNLAGTFGLCRPGEAEAAPHPLQRIHEHVLEPGLERFLVLHLEEAALSSARQRGSGSSSGSGHSVPEPLESRFPWGLREAAPCWPGAGCVPLSTSLEPGRGFAESLLPVGSCPGASVPEPLPHTRSPAALEGIHGRVSPVPVQWEAQVKLRFQLVFQEEVGRAVGELQAAVMLFYLGRREGRGSGHPQELLATGPGLPRDQRLCLSRDTQYLALAAAAASVTRSAERLRFSASLAIHGGAGGAPLPRTEVQQLLFGSDDKCFTRMTPVLLLLAKSRQQEEEEEEEEVLAPSSYLSAEGVVDTAPYPQLSPPQAGTEELPTPTAPGQANTSSPVPGGSAQFLATLTHFIRQLLSSSSEPPPQPTAHHRLDFEMMETLPHQLLNLSEEAALERLVQSEEPSVLLLPQDSGAVLEQHLGDWQPEGTVLQLLMGKLQVVIQELRDIPAFQANAALFQHLLTFCYYPAEPGQAEVAERGPGSRKLRTLLLLKALQSVRARWQERRKVQRQNRSARHQAHCRLQELTIDLRDRHFIIMPTMYAANNCEGPCRLPLSARIPSYFSHTVLLLGMQDQGSPLRRAPCCVPVRYSDQLIISLSSDGLEIRKFPNMVAEECGCR
ncbi:muellerian-inhibiting factor isoform X2 [Pyrgilauda ruficollis]|uniref:muellerian-inhibiting factor isoform X2 n=1 Tax=Pyrgilauda ruficollis TaxID=221976 RepID=UPI001B87B637|nr:muellerian-inhibiting factor isoform X2 [Pyrgilauda ruficollis]